MSEVILKNSLKKICFHFLLILALSEYASAQKDDIYNNYEVFDSDFHITNYIQEGVTIQQQLD